MGLGAMDPQDGATETAKPRPFRQLAGVVLPIALGTGYEESHETKNGANGVGESIGYSADGLQPLRHAMRLRV